MCKVEKAVSIILILVAGVAFGQGLDPYRKAILDLYYLQTNSPIDGVLIIDGSIAIEKLGFTVVTNEVDPEFTDWLGTNTYVKIEVDPVFLAWLATATVVYVESDPVFTSWESTTWPEHTNSQSAHHLSYTNLGGLSVTNEQIINGVTNQWEYQSGILTNWLTNGVLVQ